jgi:hypothetical protein
LPLDFSVHFTDGIHSSSTSHGQIDGVVHTVSPSQRSTPCWRLRRATKWSKLCM